MKNLKTLSKNIYNLQCKIKEMQLKQNKLKEEFIFNLNSVGKKTYKDEYWSIYHTDDSVNVKFDEKGFKVADLKSYNKLISKYNKPTKKSGGYSWKNVH